MQRYTDYYVANAYLSVKKRDFYVFPEKQEEYGGGRRFLRKRSI
ncbi:MAG: hypothetical protein OIN66_18180 [Candidatus Methanoperedens sp.]|nr:hypothetical protein [Candidatus Methanoperedens sp.]